MTGRAPGGAKRVLFVVHKDYPLHEPRVRRQAEAVAAAGHEVDVLSLRAQGLPDTQMVGGVRVLRAGAGRRREWSYVGLVREYGGFFLAVLRHCLTHRYDRVVVANPPDFLVFAVAPQRLAGARVILDIHDLMTDLFAFRMGRRRWAERMLAAVEQASMLAASELMTVHEPYAREVARRSKGHRRVTVVMNSADDAVFRTDGSTEREPAYIYSGSLSERNGVLELLDAFAMVAKERGDVRLWLLGDGDAVPELHRRVEGLGLDGRVEFSDGMRSIEEVAAKVCRASWCVLPQRTHAHSGRSVPTKLLEAVAVGTPVISGDRPGVREHFGDGEVLYYPAGDVRAMAAAMLEAAGDPKKMAARAEAAALRYERQYAWSAQRRRLLDLLA